MLGAPQTSFADCYSPTWLSVRQRSCFGCYSPTWLSALQTKTWLCFRRTSVALLMMCECFLSRISRFQTILEKKTPALENDATLVGR